MTVAEFKSEVSTQSSTAFPHILVAIDFSNASRRALCQAVAMAAGNPAHFSVIHVLQPDWRYATLENPPELDLQRIDAEQRIDALLREVAPQQNVKVVVDAHGPVADAVAAVINESDVDLLVIGTRSRGGLKKVALGSVAEELLRVAPCPVMTIGPRAEIQAVPLYSKFHRVLFATDFGCGSAAALPVALAIVKAHNAGLIMLHMLSPMPAATGSLSGFAPAGPAASELKEWETAMRKLALRRLKASLPERTGLGEEPGYVVGTDFLPEGIFAAVERFHADLIVMGANRGNSARTAAHIPWSAVHEVLSRAPCPVLTVAG